MNTYRISEIARANGIHTNTVRLYETLGLIPEAKRGSNGYRIFTDFHMEQTKLVRTALKVEILQNGLRKKAIDIIKTSAAGDFKQAICLTEEYIKQIKKEQENAEEAVLITEKLLTGTSKEMNDICLTRKETAEFLDVSIDALRNWEMNGLLTVKRRQNGYRIYENEDIQYLKIIRSLRCANYSLAAILRMMCALSCNQKVNIREVIDTPDEKDDIISVCDKLLTSLKNADINAHIILDELKKMKKQFKANLPL